MAVFSINDRQNMARALCLAKRGRYFVKTNPMVGCVIVRSGKIIAEGYHQQFGKAHAEINALKQIKHKADNATFYITLEPCAHFGKTNPCAQAIIDSGAEKVVIAHLDPNPLVNGKGIAMLKKAGIAVKIGLLADEASTLNRGFIKRMQSGLPFITCKIAMSLDGKIALSSGQSQWITAEAARLDGHYLRANNQAILIGSGSILADNPSMTVRLDDVVASPLRVVVDSKNQITDKRLNIFSNDAKTLIFNPKNSKILSNGKIDLTDILQQLGQLGINNVLLEAGPGLVGAMLEKQLIDEFVIYMAPILLGGDAHSMADLTIKSLTDKIKLNITDIRQVADDIKISATIK